MTEEAKNLRKERIGKPFAESEVRKKFVQSMKETRLRGANPNAVSILWDGHVFQTSAEFRNFVKEHGLNFRECTRILK